MSKVMDLVLAKKYRQALKAVSRNTKNGNLDRAKIYLLLNDPQRARADLDALEHRDARIFKERPGKFHTDHYIVGIGLTYWMEGHEELALAIWRYTTSLLTRNRVHYSNLGGGIQTALILWFASVRLKSAKDLEVVGELFKRRAASTFWSHSLDGWLAAVVDYFFRKTNAETMLKLAESVSDKCDTFLAMAARSYEDRKFKESWNYLRQIMSITDNPYKLYGVWSYHLARFECQEK